jgi:hypothetical protein
MLAAVLSAIIALVVCANKGGLSVRRILVVKRPLGRFRMPSAQWVKPQFVARVRHLAGAKTLRHATVRGINAH